MTPMLATTDLGWWGIPVGVLAGAIRVSPPYIFVSLGEMLTEKSGRINLGLEGTLVMGAMAGYGISYLSHSPWLGVLVAGMVGSLLGFLHAFICGRPRVNDIALGIALMIFGSNLAFFLGKPLVQPHAEHLASVHLGKYFEFSWLFVIGVLLAPALAWGLKHSRAGLILRTVGESADSAKAMGYSVNRVRMLATMAGGFLAGVGGAYLSLFSPGSWTESLSSGQGLMAVALVIFARWNPIYCLLASLLFGGAGALGPALQANGVTHGTYIYSAVPYVLTLVIMIGASSSKRTLAGIPAELMVGR